MDSRTVVTVCVAVCLLNVILVSGLASSGVLRSTQPGDEQSVRVLETEEFRYELPADAKRSFVGEPVVDADAFYNAVIRAEHGVSIYAPANEIIQKYHYAPVVVLPFVALAVGGYGLFKVLLFLASLAAVVGGSYVLLRGEATVREWDTSRQTLAVIAIATAGYGPMVSNFKVGQISPFIYLGVALSWYWYRQGRDGLAGAALVVAALTKPYFLAPAAVLFARRHTRGVAGLAVAVLAGLLVGVAAFGVETTVVYFEKVAAFASASEGTGVPGIQGWSVEAVYPFFSLGVVTLAGRVLAAVGLGWLWIRYQRDGATIQSGAGLFAAALVATMFMIQQTTNMDLAVCLAAYLVLGAELYDRGEGLVLLGVSFVLTTVHPYAMEVLVGGGHPNLVGLVDGPGEAALQILQPAVYGLYVLAALSVLVVLRSAEAPGLRPSAEPGDIYSTGEKRTDR